MTYQETLDFLYKQVPQYQKVGYKAFKEGLENITDLCNYLNNPQKNLNIIHLAGTNGKGSTGHLISSVLQENNFQVGIFSSPHLVDFRERIKINGEYIPETYVVDFIEKLKPIIEKIQPSFFELTTALAFGYFSTKNVDWVILETGLGGRLDSTNIVQPKISVITNISMDHQQFLGNTLEAITKEKGGIIKTNTPVVVGEEKESLKSIFEQIAADKNAPILFSSEVKQQFKSDLKGTFQQKNCQVALDTIQVLFPDMKEEIILKGFENAQKNTHFLGRWQVWSQKPLTILDIGHNEDGVKSIVENFKTESFEDLYLILGFSSDKDLNSILPLFPANASFVFTKASTNRAMEVETIKKAAQKFNLNFSTAETIEEAYNETLKVSTTKDLIFIGGSNFLVADFLEQNIP